MEVLKQDNGFTRYNFPWFAIGKMRDNGGKHVSFIYDSRREYRPHGWKIFWYTTNKSPIAIRLITDIGWYSDKTKTMFGGEFTGSMVKPDLHWTLRIGRLFFGGWTPKFVRQLNAFRMYVEHSRWGYNMEVFMASRNEPDWDMPTETWFQRFKQELRNSIVCWWKGHDIQCIDSNIGPESGSEDFGCMRCHWTQHVGYY